MDRLAGFCGWASIFLGGCSFINPDYDVPATDATASSGMSSTSDASTSATEPTTSGSTSSTDAMTAPGSTSEGPTTSTGPSTTGPTDPTDATLTDPTDPDPTDPNTDTDPETDSDTDTEGMASCPNPGPNTYKLKVTNSEDEPFVGTCGENHEAFGFVLWLDDTTLQLNTCNDDCGDCGAPYLTIEVAADDLDPTFHLTENNYAIDKCIQYEVTYDKPFEDKCKVGGLVLSDSEFYPRYVATDGRLAPPPSVSTAFSIEPLNIEDCDECDEPCCDDIYPPPGAWFLRFYGGLFQDDELVLEGETIEVPYFGYDTSVHNVRSTVPAVCGPSPMAWIMSSLPAE